MATLRENPRDTMIIAAILAENKHLGKNCSGAVRVALEHWWKAHEAARAQAQAPPAEAEAGAKRTRDDH